MSIIFNTISDAFAGDLTFATESMNTDAFSTRIRSNWRIGTEAELAASIMAEGGLFFDIGANIGAFCLPVMKKTGATCIAVEGLPQNAALLRAAIDANHLLGSAQVLNAAVADKVGELRMSGASAYGIVDAAGSVTVPAETIDRLVDQFGLPRLIKIDIEGSELQALHGAGKTLEQQPDLIFEGNGVHCRRMGYFPQDLISILEDADYDVFLVHKRSLVPVSSADYQPAGNCNYLATSAEKAGALAGFKVRDHLSADEQRAMASDTRERMSPKYLAFMRDQIGKYAMPDDVAAVLA